MQKCISAIQQALHILRDMLHDSHISKIKKHHGYAWRFFRIKTDNYFTDEVLVEEVPVGKELEVEVLFVELLTSLCFEASW